MSVDKALTPSPLDMLADPIPAIEIEILPVDEIEVEIADEPIPHDANLAEFLTDGELQNLGRELVDAYDADKRSRSEWEKTYTDGLELLGLKIEDRTQPWQGACGVFHPVLAESVVRFQAQSIMETFPPAGPVRTAVVGKLTEKKQRQARRVQDDMNYLLTQVMKEYRSEHEKLLFALPLAGAAFKKHYFDPVLGRPVSLFVPAEEFVVPYGATDLYTAPRYTHVMRRYPNEIRKLQAVGFYRDVELPEPTPDYSEIQEKKDRISGESPSIEVDDRHTLLELHVDYDLPGFEDEDEDGPTGIALPYVITVEKTSQIVLSIRRNWKEEDQLRRKRIHFSCYSYVPGVGFYALGLVHLIGGIAKSATSILRQLVDAGTLANLPGGLKSRGLRIKGDDSPISPGEFRDVDVGAGSIRDNITFLPYKEPSAVLAQLLEKLIEEARTFASISDMKIGDVNQAAPVGTTLALMERAMKVMSAVQARIHASMKDEFDILVEIVRDSLPAEYDYEPEDNATRATDYDDMVDVVPVSDPNATTMAQRITQYQAALQLAQMSPGLYDMPELHRQMLEVLGLRDVEKLIPSIAEQHPTDPVTENMNILAGKPVKVFPHQDHEAHIRVHTAAMQDPKILALVGQSPNANALQAAAQAHIAEHLGFAYRKQLEQMLGVPLPPPDQKLPEDVENAVALISANAAEKLLQKNQAEQSQQEAQQQAQDPIVQMQQQEAMAKVMEVQRKAKKDETDAFIAQEKLITERERIASQERIAGAALGVKIQTGQQGQASKERLEGAKLGVKIASNRQRMN